MRDPEEHDVAIRRIMRRDDLLTLAAAADEAVGIVRQRDTEARLGADGRTLFDLALERQLKLAETDRRWSVRAQAWDHAAILVRYCKLVGPELASPYTAVDMHARALRELEENKPRTGRRPLDKDLTLGAFNRYHAARDLRLEGRLQEARDLANRSPEDLYGTGAEPHIAHYHYELGATYIEQGHPEQIRRQLVELEGYWAGDRPQGFSTRHRFSFMQALISWSTDPGSGRATEYFDAAVELLDPDPDPGSGSGSGSEEVAVHDGADNRGVRELSLALAAAEHLVRTDGDPGAAVALGRRALAAADRVRARWRVIARSRAPLAEAFHRVYGDIALLAYRIGDERAAELGLRAALSAKATGFAARIRDGLMFDDNPKIRTFMTRIAGLENPEPGPMTSTRESHDAQLKQLWQELAEAVSPMLADTILPPAADLSAVIREIGPRYTLDYVELSDNLGTKALFRTLIEPGGRMIFDRLDPDDAFRTLVDQVRAADRGAATGREIIDPPVAGLLDTGQLDFEALARQLLPTRLTGDILPRCAGNAPVRLLISAHSWLSQIPWAALLIDPGTRLVERAVLNQCPVLTCLSGELPPPVSGDALIRLVGSDEKAEIDGMPLDDLDIAAERIAWDLPPKATGVELSRCDLANAGTPAPHGGSIADALRERGRWQFLHIAAHGGGRGFGQYLAFGRERLSAARALGLRWPVSVLMASCHVGLVRNDHGAEPLSLVMALLTGGAQCVVAGIDSVEDAATGRMAAAMVRAARLDHLPLDLALRNAQLDEIRRGTPVNGWALLSSYVR